MAHFDRGGGLEGNSPLAAVLQDVLGVSPSRRAVKGLAHRCHLMARAYLRMRMRSGSLRTDVLGGKVEDLALDAIAGLFERDERGRFPELRRYFWSQFGGEGNIQEDVLQEQLSAAEEGWLESALRRLVWSATGDWLFEAYRVADRPLSNQIRALKRAVKESGGTILDEREGEAWIVVETEKRPVESSRQMPIETMEACLAGAVAEAGSTGDLLRRAVRALRSHRTYENAYPVTRLAQAMRAARAEVQSASGIAAEHTGSTSGPKAPPVKTREVEAMIDKCVDGLREEKRSSYVESGKVSGETYRAYIQALGDRLRAKFLPRDAARDDGKNRSVEDNRPDDESPEPDSDENAYGEAESGVLERPPPNRSSFDLPREDLTHYEALSRHLGGLSKTTYREKHRSRFEYLFQEAEGRLTRRLRAAVPGASNEDEG